MGESQNGSPPQAQRAEEEVDPHSPIRGTFLGRLFGWDSQEDARSVDGDTLTESGPDRDGRGSGDMIVDMHKLTTLRVEDIAVPRADIVAVPVDADATQVLRVFRESENTRLPVYEETLDRPVGIVHLKDFALKHALVGPAQLEGSAPFDLRSLVRPLLYVPHSMRMGALLRKMQASRSHMALVIDEYGGVDGLVTIEDILEQIIGEIGDEHDVEPGRLWTRDGPGTFVMNGRVDLEEFAEETGVTLDIDLGDEVDTVGGLVTQIAGRLPERGEVIVHPDGHRFEVLDADARRIKRLRLMLASFADAVGRAAE